MDPGRKIWESVMQVALQTCGRMPINELVRLVVTGSEGLPPELWSPPASFDQLLEEVRNGRRSPAIEAPEATEPRTTLRRPKPNEEGIGQARLDKAEEGACGPEKSIQAAIPSEAPTLEGLLARANEARIKAKRKTLELEEAEAEFHLAVEELLAFPGVDARGASLGRLSANKKEEAKLLEEFRGKRRWEREQATIQEVAAAIKASEEKQREVDELRRQMRQATIEAEHQLRRLQSEAKKAVAECPPSLLEAAQSYNRTAPPEEPKPKAEALNEGAKPINGQRILPRPEKGAVGNGDARARPAVERPRREPFCFHCRWPGVKRSWMCPNRARHPAYIPRSKEE